MSNRGIRCEWAGVSPSDVFVGEVSEAFGDLSDAALAGLAGASPEQKERIEQFILRECYPMHESPPDPNMRRLTALWRYGVPILPPTCKDYYAWLDVLDAAIDERVNRRGG